MSNFKVHSLDSASEGSRAALEGTLKTIGFIPNLFSVMAESPATLEAYQHLSRLFQQTSFNAEELTVVWQTINIEHGCHYCVPAHAAIADMMKLDPALTEVLRNEKAMPTDKLQVLHDTAKLLLQKRGVLNDSELQPFYAIGYTQKHLLELVLGVAQKVMSNYINHLADTPLDEAFTPYA